jgi:hypothetical protein
MTHPRQTIRENLVALLTGLPLTGSHVYGSRVAPLAEADLPAIRVYADSSESSAIDIHNLIRERGVIFRIEIVARATADLDDTLDAIAEDVEDALLTAPGSTWLGGELRDPISDEIEVDDDTSQPVGICRMAISINTYA